MLEGRKTARNQKLMQKNVLNVAGPRESKASGIQERARLFLAEVLQGMFG